METSPEAQPVSLVLTSCGRPDLLRQTVASFRRHNTYPLAQAILVEDSGRADVFAQIQTEHGDFFDVMRLNDPKRGQIASIDRAYADVASPYIFHCEDDWLFFRDGFIEDSIDVLAFDERIINVWMRDLTQDGRSSRILPETHCAAGSTDFRFVTTNPTGNWHGFTFNPGLRRTADYQCIAPFSAVGHEFEINKAYHRLGYYAAALERPAVRHLGHGRSERKKELAGAQPFWQRLFFRHD